MIKGKLFFREEEEAKSEESGKNERRGGGWHGVMHQATSNVTRWSISGEENYVGRTDIGVARKARRILASGAERFGRTALSGPDSLFASLFLVTCHPESREPFPLLPP